MSLPSQESDDHAPVTNATRARQSRGGRHIFWVLVFGTLLSALGMFAAWTWRTAEEPVPVGQGMERVDGRTTTDTPAPPPADRSYPNGPAPN
ncbi:MAG: hypothetical protein JNK30_09575 [Phenylobacterium sp.]|uniref:hypothetical protein n=1 Tax=Phenylobacterium sp. TaxID=1871053 RepID=UPI001A405F42|nr:hypothetical protein [Phenylobacterium sp.]MBL8771618.1 hypothetical protein [Phenylobacterium sp.]